MTELTETGTYFARAAQLLPNAENADVASELAATSADMAGRHIVVHIAEAFGGGVASAINDYVRNSPYAEHHLLYAERQEAPVTDVQLEGFHATAKMPIGHISRIRWVRRYIRACGDNLTIHAHSSLAGVYARLAVRSTQTRPIVYTPHCYAFERKDISAILREGFRIVERVLSCNTQVIAACSDREVQLSRWPFRRSKVVLVPNVAPADLTSVGNSEVRFPGKLRIVGSGRLGPQKDPEFFLAIIEELRRAGHDVEAMWIGSGDFRLSTLLCSRNIEVTGWMSRERGLELLASGDVYVHSAAWEGFPVALLEAVALDVPVVVRAIDAFEGVDLPIVARTPQDILHAWEMLESEQGRQRVLVDCRRALSKYSNVEQVAALESVYLPVRKR